MNKTITPMTNKIAHFITNTDSSSIPNEVYQHAKVALMDWIAVTIGGKDDSIIKKLIKYSDIEGGNPQATIIGYNFKKTISQAALINGAASHVLDYDDTLVSFMGHPSVTLFPSLLALAEWKGINGYDFLTAYIIGLQAGATVGSCAGMEHYMAGWHATSTLGHIASAAGCSRLLKLNEQQTVYALGIAATQSSGLKRVFGTMCKPFHAGKSSQSGMMSALLAQDNFSSANDILEGPHGFFNVLKGNVQDNILELLGLGWDVVNLSQKYHASCHATHSPIEASMNIIKKNNIKIDDIKSICVKSSQLALDAAGKNEIQSGMEGKFSIPYCIANAIVTGITGNEAFSDNKISNPEVKKLMKKVNVVLDHSKVGLEAHVELKTLTGYSYEDFSDILQKNPSLEIKKIKVKDKFFDLCKPQLGIEKTKAIACIVDSIENISNINEITNLLRNS